MTNLQDRTAIVTGASRGIGRAIALAFAGEGARVVVTARSTDLLDELADEVRRAGTEAVAVAADLAVEADINRIAEAARAAFGRIDILVNNAGIIHPKVDLVDFDSDLWRRVIDVNLTAPALLAKAVLPAMIEQKSGKILNISSIGGRKGARSRTAYRATKAALISLTESLAAEVKHHGIDVNCICPGGVDTEGYREAFQMRGRDDDPRLMAPAEIAALAVFLAGDASSAITGAAVDAFGTTNPLFG